MAILKKTELDHLSETEINKRLEQLKTEIMKDNSQVAAGTVPKNPGNLRNNKKNIARLLTILNTKKKDIKPEVVKKDE